MKGITSIEDNILAAIKEKGRGNIFFPFRFYIYGRTKAIGKSLERLVSKGTIIRLARGIYIYPEVDTELGLGALMPSVEQIAETIARRDKARIVPTGIYAMNRLGISTQVPMNFVYLTDGTPRKVNLGKGRSIQFKYTTPKNLSFTNLLVCYEIHKKGSCIKEDIENGILNNLNIKFSIDPFKCLLLSFFGGEPFIRHKQVSRIISSIKSFCEEKGIILRVDFTTNGTIWSPSLIKELQEITSVSFQITLDGSDSQHDKVRCFKYGGSGTYKIILENISKIFAELPNAHVTIRINFDNMTFNTVETLEKILLSFPPSQFRVALHKVWQVDAATINYEQIFDFINTLQEQGIDVRFLEFSHGETTCYADKINSIVINYDGNIYKCTARNFNSENRVGKLLKTGEISWDYSKLKESCFASIPSKCQECKIFPICTGVCSQKVIEMGNQAPCVINSQFSIEDYILYNYKVNQILNLQKS